jgi:hypothetical protein
MAYTDIDKPSDYFNTVLYTGNATNRNITGLDFQPDWVWVKSRSDNDNNVVSDSVRGANKQIFTNGSDAELSSTTQITSFNSDGFGLGTDISVNGNGRTFASWNWKAGGTAVSNTDGDITSSVSANTTSGFSIVSWTANGSNTDTVGHGLGVAPKIALYKQLNGTTDWFYWTTQFDGSNQSLRFNSPSSTVYPSGSTYGSITSSTISNFAWLVGNNMICYCFAEKTGFSKFGKYTGNGSSTDGTFVYTGFKPAYVLIKAYDAGINAAWRTYDNKRNTYNEVNKSLQPHSNNNTAILIAGDFTSNGFKLRQTNRTLNQLGTSYIYMAFAENPFVTSTGVPTTAR